MTGWPKLAAALADELTALGKLCSPQWQAVMRALPRHELVPVHHTLDPHTDEWTEQRTALAEAYSNTALFVLPGGHSSTSMPGLMTRMLESLDVQDGHRVLEIGAGYNTALLCHRLGDDRGFAGVTDQLPSCRGVLHQDGGAVTGEYTTTEPISARLRLDQLL